VPLNIFTPIYKGSVISVIPATSIEINQAHDHIGYCNEPVSGVHCCYDVVKFIEKMRSTTVSVTAANVHVVLLPFPDVSDEAKFVIHSQRDLELQDRNIREKVREELECAKQRDVAMAQSDRLWSRIHYDR
jgi:hypothetical protein